MQQVTIVALMAGADGDECLVEHLDASDFGGFVSRVLAFRADPDCIKLSWRVLEWGPEGPTEAMSPWPDPPVRATGLPHLADRLAGDATFIAGCVSTSALMAALGVDEATAVKVRLCRTPQHAGDLGLIADRFGLEVDALAVALAGSLSRAADRAASRPDYIAAHRSTAAVLTALGCDRETAARVRLCRWPRQERWEADVTEIATYAGVALEKLAALVGKGE